LGLSLALATAASAGLIALAIPTRADTTVARFGRFPEHPIQGNWVEFDARSGATVAISDLSGEGADMEHHQPPSAGAALRTTISGSTARAGLGVARSCGTLGDILLDAQFQRRVLQGGCRKRKRGRHSYVVGS
jgi:hypothetical protein